MSTKYQYKDPFTQKVVEPEPKEMTIEKALEEVLGYQVKIIK